MLYAGLGALALVWLVYDRLLPISGTIGFWLSWYAVFLVLLAAISATSAGPDGGGRPHRRRAGHARPG